MVSRIERVWSTVLRSPTCREASSRVRLLELLAALERRDAGPQQVLEDEENDSEQADGADADPAVAERHAGREESGRELDGSTVT